MGSASASASVFHRKVRRHSVLLDLFDRVKILDDFAEIVHTKRAFTAAEFGKNTLLEYLNITKIVMSSDMRTSSLQTEADKLVVDDSLQADTYRPYEDAQRFALAQDNYVRAVGHFTPYLTGDELSSRIRQLSDHVAGLTRGLIRVCCAYVNLFYGPPSRAIDMAAADRYINTLNSYDTNIALLQFLDVDKISKRLRELPEDHLQRFAALVECNLPRVYVKTKPRSLLDRLRSGSHQSPSDRLQAMIQKYLAIASELHADKNAKYIVEHLPPRTQFATLLNGKLADSFPSIDAYITEVDKRQRLRITTDSFSSIFISLIRGISVLAAFRTLLFAKELQALKTEWSLLELPDRSDLDSFLASTYPNDL